jgi:hypothetical protein
MKVTAGLSVLLLCDTGCSPSDDAAPETVNEGLDDPESYCAPLAPHLTEICSSLLGPFSPSFGASMRASCRAFPIPSERNCLLSLSECSEEALDSCDAADRTFTCGGDADCGGGLICDIEGLGECVECLLDSNCPTGSFCDYGLCIP